MEKANSPGVEPENYPGKPLSLGLAVIEAVCEAICKKSDQLLALPPAAFAAQETEANPGQVAMAVAYANLCLEEPEMVTSSHKKMLRATFSFEQIQDLNQLIQMLMP